MKILISPIKTETDYESTLKRIEEIWGADSNTPHGDELDILIPLVEAYEEKHFPIPPPDPIEAIKFRLDQLGMKKAHLKDFLGYRSRVSEILSGKRKLTLKMMVKLHNELGVPAESLLSTKALDEG